MSLTETKIFKVFICPILGLSCWVILLESYRATARVFMVALIVAYIHFLLSFKTKWMRLIFVAFLVATFLPVDVSLRNYPGLPRFVPLVMGSPTDEDVARESRGEVVLGGCILRGNPPRWILVW